VTVRNPDDTFGVVNDADVLQEMLSPDSSLPQASAARMELERLPSSYLCSAASSLSLILPFKTYLH
jgi:hypothetical protein